MCFLICIELNCFSSYKNYMLIAKHKTFHRARAYSFTPKAGKAAKEPVWSI